MIGCYLTGILPRPNELVRITRRYDRGSLSEKKLEEAFENATLEVIESQLSFGFSYVTDGMLKWNDLFRPLLENIHGVRIGSLIRWFNNNTFYRKPIIMGALARKKKTMHEIFYTEHLPPHLPWKAILPAPYTFAEYSENQYYPSKIQLMFDYAKVLREEIKRLGLLGFQLIQLSDPALVYKSTAGSIASDDLNQICEALRVAVEGLPVKTCLQTFFGDFSRILPEILNVPTDQVGIDLYETDIEELREYEFEKEVALGIVDSRSSLVENESELATIAKEIVTSIYPATLRKVFICPNCDLEFLPWERAKQKMEVVGNVATRLGREFS